MRMGVSPYKINGVVSAHARLTVSGAPAFDFSHVVNVVSPAVVAAQVSGEVPADVSGDGSMFPSVPENHPLRPFFGDLERRSSTPGRGEENTHVPGKKSGFD